MAAVERNFTEIEAGLFVGGMVPVPPEGTGAVLCLSKHKDVYTAEVYQWSPIMDVRPVPSLEWLREQVMFVDGQRRAGRVVYVHCDAGVSRSGMVIVAYFMWRDGMSVEEALAFVRSKREKVNPNPYFMTLLREWGEAVKGDSAADSTKDQNNHVNN